MVYETDYYTRRTYSRPTVSSYSVTLPSTRYTSRVHTTGYPIYSYHSTPYVSSTRRVVTSRVVTSPFRVIASPIRVVHSSARLISSPRVYSSPIRVFSSPIRVLSPVRVVTSPVRALPSSTHYTSILPSSRYYRATSYDSDESSKVPRFRTLPSVYNKEYERIANRTRPGIGYRMLNEFLNSDTFIDFDTEARKIRSSAATLLKEVSAPTSRRSRSTTPFPAYRYEPHSTSALDTYVSRVTNPSRGVDVDSLISSYPEKPKYTGDKGYKIRTPLYIPDGKNRVKKDVEFLSHYLKNRVRAAGRRTEKPEVKLESTEAKEVAASG